MGWRFALTRSWSLIRINTVSVAWEKIRHFATPPLVSASADLNFHTDDSASYC